jgi:hypothetical protein
MFRLKLGKANRKKLPAMRPGKDDAQVFDASQPSLTDRRQDISRFCEDFSAAVEEGERDREPRLGKSLWQRQSGGPVLKHSRTLALCSGADQARCPDRVRGSG